MAMNEIPTIGEFDEPVDILAAFDAQAECIVGLKREVARLRLIEQRLGWYQLNCSVWMLVEDAKRLAVAAKETT